MSFHWEERVHNIEDPVSGLMMDLVSFRCTYGLIVVQLDGSDRDMKPEYWIEPNPLNRTSWRFRNDNLKDEFVDWAIAENLIPTLRETCEGEDDVDRRARKGAAVPPSAPREVIPRPPPDRRAQEANIRATIAGLEARIARGGEPTLVGTLVAKRERAYLLLNKMLDVTR